jgi:NAD(P)-dependent dehydrogenase (short-subunit alcohol dehydrogenase family)
MTRLSDKTCIVTGAARGIGAAIARAFVAEGAEVLITDKNEDGASKLGSEIGAQSLRLDVSVENDWTELEKVLPKVDVLVNNAGVTGIEDGVAHDPEAVSLDAWRAVHQVNLDGVFLGCRYAIKSMRKTGAGSIINMSSRSGVVGIPGAAAYASSKAGVRNHTKTVALYCAEQGLKVRCNSIHPGAILTPMWEPMLGQGPDWDDRIAAITAGTPLKRFGRPEEVAALAVYLASDESAYMTGAELTLDGGILAGSTASPSPEK